MCRQIANALSRTQTFSNIQIEHIFLWFLLVFYFIAPASVCILIWHFSSLYFAWYFDTGKFSIEIEQNGYILVLHEVSFNCTSFKQYPIEDSIIIMMVMIISSKTFVSSRFYNKNDNWAKDKTCSSNLMPYWCFEMILTVAVFCRLKD